MDLAAQLERIGIKNPSRIYRNLPPAQLIEMALARKEGLLAANGALVVRTGVPSGRSPLDKFIVEEPETRDEIDWGQVNVSCQGDLFDRMLDKAAAFLENREIFVFDGFVGADPKYRMKVRVITPIAWHALFAHTLFLRPAPAELDGFQPGFTVVGCGLLKADPAQDGTRSQVFVGVNFQRRLNLILGSMYGGEIKKSIFTILNFLLPQQGVFPMHCSANMGERGDTALFFGLSGTGKTTLSADPARRLIGDDEHGWSDSGIFNFEGGCYAKVIRLSAEAEPQIYRAIKFGSILENVVVEESTRSIDYDSDAITENTRATYPVEHIPNCLIPGIGGHPQNVFFLACDAFGVLPPIARLTPAMAGYHFLSGFTAKLAGTESGIDKPQPTFSACFGAPFMPRHPSRYAQMLMDRLTKHGANCWLVNTGWSGGGVGVGHRMKIAVTRALLSAALEGKLEKAEFVPDPVFKILVPRSCPGVPTDVLQPRHTWADKDAYDRQARELAAMFVKNFERYRAQTPAEITASGPQI